MRTCHFNLSAVCCGQDFIQVLLLLSDLTHHLTAGWGMDQKKEAATGTPASERYALPPIVEQYNSSPSPRAPEPYIPPSPVV